MYIDFQTIQTTFSQDIKNFNNHQFIIKKEGNYKISSKQDLQKELKNNYKKIHLNEIINSLYNEIATKNLNQIQCRTILNLSHFFIKKTTQSRYTWINKIKQIYSRFHNLFSGYGFKSNFELSKRLECLASEKVNLQTVQSEKSFIPQDFWVSMSSHRQPTLPEFFKDEDMKIAFKNFNSFCQKINSQKCELKNEFSIPSTIHFIWLGSSLPEKVKNNIETYRQYNPDFEIKIWTDKELKNYPLINRKAFDQATSKAEQADIWRYEILFNEGGIYSDTDIVCYKSFKDLISHNINCFAGQENNHGAFWGGYNKCLVLCNALIGAAKGSPVMKCCIDNLKSSVDSNENISFRTGPILFSRSFSKSLHSSKSEDFLVLPCSYFYPLPFSSDVKQKQPNPSEYVEPETLAVHLWEGSWVKS